MRTVVNLPHITEGPSVTLPLGATKAEHQAVTGWREFSMHAHT